MTFQPTEEQQAILDAAKSTSDNLLVSALAGAAKTSTLVLLGKALPSTSILALAFNAKIAKEMRERLTPNCQSKTLNGLGYNTWRQFISKQVTVNPSKNYEILSSLIEDLGPGDKAVAFGMLGETLKAVAQGKAAGFVPEGTPNARPLIDENDLFASLDEEPTLLQEQLIIDTSRISIQRAFAGEMDFDDQILLPTVFPASFPKYPLTLVDEAQDLSALNHAMLRKIVGKRLIAVGDRNQAIYGFRGAHANSMDLLQQQFSMQEMTLSISFRCPVSVVEAARWRAPNMRYPEWAKPGEVRTLHRWSESDIPENAAIICRNNAPLFRLALSFIKAGRYPQLMGNDIGKNLIKIMKKLGDSKMPSAEAHTAVDKWKEEKLSRTRSPGSVHDQAECMHIFIEAGDSLGGAIAYAEHLFNSSGPIKMMTIHKSKGLEFPHVFILEKDLIRLGQGQEDNLLYVAQTRAMETLTYIHMEGME